MNQNTQVVCKLDKKEFVLKCMLHAFNRQWGLQLRGYHHPQRGINSVGLHMERYLILQNNGKLYNALVCKFIPVNL